ncbi:MAG: hypothetical protein RJA61_586 [Candidatus Parcubacteria bacterium]|jgi:elongation factor Ts
MVTTEQIKQLRDETGLSIMQCKKALIEAKGDMEKARVIIQKFSKGLAAKKGDRTLGAGTVVSYIHATNTAGALVLLASETDFVSKNDDFRALAREIAMHITASNPQFLRVEDINEHDKKVASEVFAEEVKDKPKAMQEKILQGKLDAYFKEKVLLTQPFIKNPDLTISDLIEQAIQKFGEKVEIVKFSRFSL